jgi:polyisoprenoid-binding protein YceI
VSDTVPNSLLRSASAGRPPDTRRPRHPLLAHGALGLALLVAACTAPAQRGAPPAEPRSSAAGTPVADAPAVERTSEGIRLVLDPTSSEARYRAREQLAGRALPSEAVGSTRTVSGTIVLDAAGTIVREASKVTVDLRSLRSDEQRRDNYIQRNTLKTDQFPTAEFVPTQIRGLPSPPPAGELAFQLLGDLTVHGTTRPVVWEVTARVDDTEVVGTATTQVKITDFGMELPRVALVLSIEDAIVLEVDFRATRSPVLS